MNCFWKKIFNSKPDKKSEYVQKICSRFKEYIPDIAPENIYKKITYFFIDEVLKPVFEEYKKEHNISDDITASKAAKDSTFVSPGPNTITSSQQDTEKGNKDNQPIEAGNNISSSGIERERNVFETHLTENHTDNHIEDNSVDLVNINNTNTENTSVNFTPNHITHIEDNSSNTRIITISSKNADDLEEIKSLINKLNSHFIELAETGSSLYLSSWTRTNEEQNEREQEFIKLKESFIEENKKLRLYFLVFPELKEAFEEMISLSASLTFWYGFKTNEDNNMFLKCNPQIEEYQKHVEAVWAALNPRG